MTKDELLNGLNNLLNNFLYGFVCSKLATPEAWSQASSKAAVFGDIEIQLGPLAKRVLDPDPEQRKRFLRNYETSLVRAIVRESHELILLYCEETGQYKKYEAASWYQFARIMRNTVSHKEGGTLRVWPNDLMKKGITTATWSNRTLDTTMVGTALTFYPPEALELLKDQIDFVASKLS